LWPDQDSCPTSAELRSFLKQRLPDYMVPSAFVFLDSLPLTPNGKIDHGALPAPDESCRKLEETYVAPRTPTEELLAEIWAEVLNLEKVGIHDNFFDLGGHSLLATQVVSRVRGALQVELPLRELFESATPAELAERVDRSRRKEQGLQALPLVPVSREKPLPLSFAQRRLWFLDQLEPGSGIYNVPMAVRMEGKLDEEAFERTLSELVRRHEVLRTRFGVKEGEPVQLIGEAERVVMPVIDLRE